jgi:isoquinoline 1-oxidoreductase beta subunit
MAPVGDVELRDPSTWRMVGKDMMRLDILPKSTGTLTYGIDLEVDGMVHASVRMNPRKGAGVLSYDASTANAMAGVSQVLPVTNGVAAVASNTWYAIQAVNAVQVEWADAPYPHEQADHWAAVAASFTPEHLDKEWRHDGDVPAALEAGDVLSSEYRAPYVAHQPLEPLSAIVLVTDARVDVWIAHQMPRFAQARVAAITGHDTDDVYLHNQYMGGSFGHRLEFENLDRATEIALALKGTPVKMTFSREEDFTQDFPRQIGMSRASGTVKNGQIESYDLHIATPSSGRSQSGRLGGEAPGADSQIPAGAWNMPYDLPNLRVTAYAVPELAPISSWRSVGASTGGFFGEGFMDELCHAAGADPMEERLRLVNDPVARKVLEAAAEMSNWGSEMAQGQGRGVAFVSSFGTPVAEVVEVTNTSSGIRIDRVYVVADVGRVIDPVNFENLVQGGVIWGLGHAINSEITYSDGMAEQTNYHAAEGMRLYQTPEIIVRGLENGNKIKGIGEPPIPPAGPALANAIFAATGQRLREMPFYNHIDFV